MSYIGIYEIKKELIYFLRNADILSTSERGVTTSQDTGTFASDSTHTLSTNPTTLKNIRSVVIGGTTLKYGRDYTIDESTGVVTFTSPQTGAYTIDYDTGTRDRIFPDFPQDSLKSTDFPRIGCDIISGLSSEIELGVASTFTDYVVSVNAYDKDQKDVEQMVASIRASLMANKKSFYYFPFIKPTGMSPLIQSPFGNTKIFQRGQDFSIRFVYED